MRPGFSSIEGLPLRERTRRDLIGCVARLLRFALACRIAEPLPGFRHFDQPGLLSLITGLLGNAPAFGRELFVSLDCSRHAAARIAKMQV